MDDGMNENELLLNTLFSAEVKAGMVKLSIAAILLLPLRKVAESERRRVQKTKALCLKSRGN